MKLQKIFFSRLVFLLMCISAARSMLVFDTVEEFKHYLLKGPQTPRKLIEKMVTDQGVASPLRILHEYPYAISFLSDLRENVVYAFKSLNSERYISVPPNDSPKMTQFYKQPEIGSLFKIKKSENYDSHFYIINLQRNQALDFKMMKLEPKIARETPTVITSDLVDPEDGQEATDQLWTLNKLPVNEKNRFFMIQNYSNDLVWNIRGGQRSAGGDLILSRLNDQVFSQQFKVYAISDADSKLLNFSDSDKDTDEDFAEYVVVHVPGVVTHEEAEEEEIKQNARSFEASNDSSLEDEKSDESGSTIGDASEDSEGSDDSEDSGEESAANYECEDEHACRRKKKCEAFGKVWWLGLCLKPRQVKWRRRCWRKAGCRKKMECWQDKKCKLKIPCQRKRKCQRRVRCWRRGYYWWGGRCWTKRRCKGNSQCWTNMIFGCPYEDKDYDLSENSSNEDKSVESSKTGKTNDSSFIQISEETEKKESEKSKKTKKSDNSKNIDKSIKS